MTTAGQGPQRSWLFVPGDSEKKLTKAAGIAADVLILDLEDAVMPERKVVARGLVRDYLAERPHPRRQQLWVRINPLDHAEAGADLGAVMPLRPDGVVLPKTRSPDDVEVLGRRLGTYEAEHDFPVGSTRILPVATETPQALFSLGDYARCATRLAGITWGAEDLAAAVGATANREPDGPTSSCAACACSRRMPPASRPSIRCGQISATPQDSSPPARKRGATASAASWPSTQTRST